MAAPLLDRFPGIDVASLNAFELAAIVYEDGVSIDDLMCFFAADLRDAGRRVGGVVQLPTGDDEPAPFVTLCDLVTRDRWLVAADGRPADPMDADALREACRRVKRSVEMRADLAIVPRFGRREIDGGGFADAFGTLAAFGVPVLTAVRRADVDAWLTFTGGIGTLIACRLKVVRGWWQETDGRRARLLARRASAASDAPPVVPLLPSWR